MPATRGPKGMAGTGRPGGLRREQALPSPGPQVSGLLTCEHPSFKATRHGVLCEGRPPEDMNRATSRSSCQLPSEGTPYSCYLPVAL